jgi:hypothetical protein
MMETVKKVGKYALAITFGAVWAVTIIWEEHRNRRGRA